MRRAMTALSAGSRPTATWPAAPPPIGSVLASSLTLTNTDEGVVLVNGILDKVGGAALRTALEPLARRAGKDDDRLRDRRLADALVDLSMHALDTGLVPQRTHMQVTTSLETLLGL